MKIYPKKATKFLWCRFWLGSKEYNKSTGETTKREAEKAAWAIRAKLESAARPPELRPTAAVLRDMDLKRARAEGRHPGYINDQLAHHWKTVARELPDVACLTDAHLIAFVEQRRKQGLSGKSIRNELSTLKRGLRLASAIYDVQLPANWPRVKLDPASKQKGNYFGQAKTQAWLDKLKGEAADIATFAVLTGMRRDELYRAKPDWVRDADRGALLPGLIVIDEGEPEERSIGLSPTAWDIARRALPFKSDHKKTFQTAGRAVGIPEGRIKLRDCRHTFATVADRAGDQRCTDILMGHGSKRVSRRYQTADLERQSKVVLHVERWVTQRGP